MPKFRADFDVRGSLVLPAGAEPLALHCDDPACEILIRNAEPDASGHVPHLNVQVVATSESIDAVPSEFRGILAHQLDLLTFVTHSTFLIDQCRRVVEWEPYQKKRAFKAMQEFDPLYPPDPILGSENIETAQAISQARPAGYVQRALHYFRYGVLSHQLEDQFQQFWLSIEVIAEGRKEGTRVPIPCPICDGPLRCEHCNDTPLRRPMARQAIRDLIEMIVKDDPKGAYRTLVSVRDGLAHGRSRESIETEVGRPVGDLVDLAGAISWHAIMSSLPEIEGPLNFADRGGHFVNERLITGPIGTFEHKGEAEHPAEDKIPSVKIELLTRFGSPPGSGE